MKATLDSLSVVTTTIATTVTTTLRHVGGLRDDLSLALVHGAADVVVLVSFRLGNLPQGVSGARAHGQLYRQLLVP